VTGWQGFRGKVSYMSDYVRGKEHLVNILEERSLFNWVSRGLKIFEVINHLFLIVRLIEHEDLE
jgi:hypothetical protein